MTARKPAESGGNIIVTRLKDDTDARATARAVLRPSIGAAIATQSVYGKFIGGELLDVGGLCEELTAQCTAVHGGDLKRMESILVAQAHTLDALFNRLTQRAMAQEYLKQFDTYLRLALKAQAQARATVEALAEIKNPRPVAFVKQANIGENVQVNNAITGAYAGPCAHTGGNVDIAQNEQLPDRRGELPGGQGSPTTRIAEEARDEVGISGAGDERAGQDRSDLRRAP